MTKHNKKNIILVLNRYNANKRRKKLLKIKNRLASYVPTRTAKKTLYIILFFHFAQMENIKTFFNSNFEELDTEQVEELENKLDTEKHFYFEVGGAEFRMIDENFIEDIFEDYIYDLVEDFYFTKDNELQRYFDYNAFIRDAKMDGYGHHFSSYDGSEEYFDGFYIFRTN